VRSHRSPAGGRRRVRLLPADCGATLAELAIVLGLVSLLAATTAPLTKAATERGRARQAAMFVAGVLRNARQQALVQSRSVGLVFDLAASRWTFRLCEDGNGNGLRRADVAAGTDVCFGDRVDLAVLFPGVRVAVDPGLRGPGGEPGSPDPVRFGASDMASFSAIGSCTAGSVFLQAADGTPFVVRVAGITGRTRVLRYETRSRVWLGE
jgi:type II secretory pathway pseudopilin PulG